jgi:hypothetical protein
MQLVVATALQRVELELVPGHPVYVDAGLSLRPGEGILMTVKPTSSTVGARNGKAPVEREQVSV